MAKTAFKGAPVTLAGEFVKVGTSAPEFTLVKGDLSNYTLKDGKGKYLILNIFPVWTQVYALLPYASSISWLQTSPIR